MKRSRLHAFSRKRIERCKHFPRLAVIETQCLKREVSVCRRARRGRGRYWRGFACGGGGAFRGRRCDLRKGFLLGSLQFGDLTRHLVLTRGDLLDGCSRLGKMPLDGLSHCDDIRLYLLHLARVRRKSGWRFRNIRDRWRRAFWTARLLCPAKLLDPVRNHLLRFGRPPKVRGACRDHLLWWLAGSLPSPGGCNWNTYGRVVAR